MCCCCTPPPPPLLLLHRFQLTKSRFLSLPFPLPNKVALNLHLLPLILQFFYCLTHTVSRCFHRLLCTVGTCNFNIPTVRTNLQLIQTTPSTMLITRLKCSFFVQIYYGWKLRNITVIYGAVGACMMQTILSLSPVWSWAMELFNPINWLFSGCSGNESGVTMLLKLHINQ